MGNTCHFFAGIGVWSVHPHARGEHRLVHAMNDTTPGSSPRPWGTRLEIDVRGQAYRFIPTPVGNTLPAAFPSLRSPVHPHARGEHQAAISLCQGTVGSSPRPWGTLNRLVLFGLGLRFIPTPVGNTVFGCPLPATSTVHPHARGEHSAISKGRAPRVGSSPRPWGTRASSNAFIPSVRFIPTPVGNTRAQSGTGRAGAVHPHARGEHICSLPHATVHPGSSPRPWGTPTHTPVGSKMYRFIPTPVGNTSSPACREHS